MSRNDLLDEKIKENISKARYQEPKEKKDNKPIFYLVVVSLVALAVLFSLLRNF